jgi:hypothetical protein
MAGWSSNRATFFSVVPAITAGIVAMVVALTEPVWVVVPWAATSCVARALSLASRRSGNDWMSGPLIVRPWRPSLHLLESELDDTDQNENDDDDHDNAHDSNAAVSRVHAGPPLGNPRSSALFLSGSLIPDHVPERFNRAIDATNALQPRALNQHEGVQH